MLKIIPFDIILSDIKQRIEIFHEFSTACLFNPVEFEKLVKDLTLLNIDKIYAKNFFMVFQEGSLNMLFIKPFVFYQESQELFFYSVYLKTSKTRSQTVLMESFQCSSSWCCTFSIHFRYFKFLQTSLFSCQHR